MPGSQTSACEDRESAQPATAPSTCSLHTQTRHHHQLQQEKSVSPQGDLFLPTSSASGSASDSPPSAAVSTCPSSTSLRILDRRGSCWSLELAGLESPSPTSLLSKLTANNSPPAPPAVDNQVAFAVRSSTATNGQREAEGYFFNWNLRKSVSSEHNHSKTSRHRRGSSILDDISPNAFSSHTTNSSSSIASCSTISLPSSSTTVTTPGLGSGRNPTLFLLSPTTLFPTSSSATALAEMAHSGFMATTNLHNQNIPRVVNMRLQLPPNALSAVASSSSTSSASPTNAAFSTAHHHNHHLHHHHVQHSYPSYMCTPDRDASEPSMENFLNNNLSGGGGGGGGRVGKDGSSASNNNNNNINTNSSPLTTAPGKQQLVGSMALLTPPEEASLVWKSKTSPPSSSSSSTSTTPKPTTTKTIPEANIVENDGGNPSKSGPPPLPEQSRDNNQTEKSVSLADKAERPGLNRCGGGDGEAGGSTGSQGSEHSDKTAKGTSQSNETPEIRKWLADALEKMFEPGVPVQGTSEAVRVLSFTSPCPISLGDPNPESSMYLRQQDRLPASAQSAPAVAAAANRQLSPVVVARCSTRTRPPTTPPSYRGHEPSGIITAAYDLVTSIQDRFADEIHKTYVQVFHAISPLFPLNRVAGTPPSTYGAGARSVNGEIPGYFSPSVFNSIVMAHAPNLFPSAPIFSPNPILPPMSIHYTLFERYIPPATADEDRNLFGASSMLSDRLCELSERNGSLLFIYPTKAGGKTFLDDYLGPVLDPLLRKYMVLYRLRDSLLWKIRHMAAAAQLRSFETLEDELKRFCHGKATVVYSAKKRVQLEDVAWREWWVEQEAERVRACFKTHASVPLPTRRSTHTSVGSPEVENRENGFIQGYGTPGDLAREILDSVRIVTRRPTSQGMGEAVFASSVGIEGALGSTVSAQYAKHIEGIEVGVFVLRRDTAATETI